MKRIYYIICLSSLFFGACTARSVSSDNATEASAALLNVNNKSSDELLKFEPKTLAEGEVCVSHQCFCGPNECSYGATCNNNTCVEAASCSFKLEYTRINLKPIPFEYAQKYDNFEEIYWICKSDFCEYEQYKIPKNVGFYKYNVTCADQVIPISALKKVKCVEYGWEINENYIPDEIDKNLNHKYAVDCDGTEDRIIEVCGYKRGTSLCISSVGCKCDGPRGYGSNSVTCSPGDICTPGKGCSFSESELSEFVLCKTGNCECGENRCGKGQTCAFGNCYFNGEINNSFPGCSFSSEFIRCGSSVPMELYETINCEEDVSRRPKEIEGFKYTAISPDSDSWCDKPEYFWKCVDSSGCSCGGAFCPQGAVCENEECFGLKTGEISHDDLVRFDLPAKKDGYMIDEDLLRCSEGKKCWCNGEVLPQGAICEVTKSGKERIVCDRYNDEDIPKNSNGYKCNSYHWVCENDNCICNGMKLPKNAVCSVRDSEETIACDGMSLPKNGKGYECTGTYSNGWACKDGQTCMCAGYALPVNAKCLVESSGVEAISVSGFIFTGDPKHYTFTESGPKCIKTGGCTCNGTQLPDNTFCQYNKSVCDREALSDWNGYECVKSVQESYKNGLLQSHDVYEWKKKTLVRSISDNPTNATNSNNINSNDTQRLNQKDDLRDHRVTNCANVLKLSHSQQYVCDQEIAICDVQTGCICGDQTIPKGNVCREEYSSGDGFESAHDIQLDVRGEICNSTRGCECAGQLCPVTGICSPNGCIDPLTNQPFQQKDGYLVSGLLRQCNSKEGCACNDETIEFGHYCIAGKSFSDVHSMLKNGERWVGDYQYYSCESDTREFNINNKKLEVFNLSSENYMIKDCFYQDPNYYGDWGYRHFYMPECASQTGCVCGDSRCKVGETCVSNQCIKDYPCSGNLDYGPDCSGNLDYESDCD